VVDDDGNLSNVFAPAFFGLEAIVVKSLGAGTVYGVGATVTAGAVTVCWVVSYTVSYTIELANAVRVLVGMPIDGEAVSVTKTVFDCVTVEGIYVTSQTVLYCSGLDMMVMLVEVALMVVGMLVKYRGP